MEWIVLTASFLFVMLMAWGMINQSRRCQARIEVEGEQCERGVSLLGVGAMSLQEVLRADLEKATALREDWRQGRLPSAFQENNRAEQAVAREE